MHNLPNSVQHQLDVLQSNASLAARCRDWLERLPEETQLVEEDGSSGLGSVTLNDLAQIRSSIASLKARAAQPAPAQDIEAQARRWVAARATPPSINAQAGRFEVAMPENTVGLLAWLFPAEMTTALARATSQDLDQQLVADKMRQHAAARLAQEILELERIEETMVRRLIAEGVAVSRRSDAAPPAVLGVSVSRF